MNMKAGKDFGLHRMDVDTAKAIGHGYGAHQGIVHSPRLRSKSRGGCIAGVIRDAKYGWPSDADGVLLSTVRHLGIKNPDGRSCFAVCFTHGEAVAVRSRAALFHGAVFTAAMDTLDATDAPKRRMNSTAGTDNLRDGKPVVPIAWCAGCASAVDASL